VDEDNEEFENGIKPDEDSKGNSTYADGFDEAFDGDSDGVRNSDDEDNSIADH
jgi:hypothetical protein